MIRRSLLMAFAFVASGGFMLQGAIAGGHESPIPPTEIAETPSIAEGDVVVVIGATGRTGRAAVAQLTDAGVTVRASARDLDKAKADISADYDWVYVDVTEPDSIAAALEGASYVISTIGNGRMPEEIDYQGVANIVDAAVAAGTVKHMALVSSAGVTHEDHYLNKMFNNLLKWKLKGEDQLRASGLNYTVVRPYGLLDEADFDSISKHTSILMDQGDDINPNGLINRSDVATVCIKSLTNPDANKKTFEVTNFLAFEPTKWEMQFGLMEEDAPMTAE